jgi:hypothetical protein
VVGREATKEGGARHILLSFVRWFDSWAGAEEIVTVPEKRLDGFRVVPVRGAPERGRPVPGPENIRK